MEDSISKEVIVLCIYVEAYMLSRTHYLHNTCERNKHNVTFSFQHNWIAEIGWNPTSSASHKNNIGILGFQLELLVNNLSHKKT